MTAQSRDVFQENIYIFFGFSLQGDIMLFNKLHLGKVESQHCKLGSEGLKTGSQDIEKLMGKRLLDTVYTCTNLNHTGESTKSHYKDNDLLIL